MKAKLLLLISVSVFVSACGKGGFVAGTNQYLTANEKEQYYSDELNGKFSMASSDETVPVVDDEGTAEEILSDLPLVDTDCFPNQIYDIWMINNDPERKSTGQFIGSITAFRGAKSAVKNYSYKSSSAHPEVGPQPEPMTSTIFMYEDGAGANLTFFHNVDSDREEIGSPSNKVSWKITTEGAGRDRVLLSDDKLELREVLKQKVLPKYGQTMSMAPMQFNTKKVYKAVWNYWYNTDGGIIGPFNTGDLYIKIEMLKLGDIKDIQFASKSGSTIRVPNTGKKMTFALKPKRSTSFVKGAPGFCGE